MINVIRAFLVFVEICCVAHYTVLCLKEEDFNKGLECLFEAAINAGLLYFLWTYPTLH